MYSLFAVVVVPGFQRDFAAEFHLWLLSLVLVFVLIVGFRFHNLIGFCFFRFQSGIGLLSVCGNKICLCYSLV